MMEKIFFWSFILLGVVGAAICVGDTMESTRILLDTDFDTDDIFALFYILKHNRSKIDLKAITISANAWSSAGHAINHIYDILYMMDRDDIAVGVGGEGGISSNGTIQENVGGYLPIIDQGLSTVGDCRYRQSIPLNQNGRLDIDTTLGVSKEFLPQGDRKYSPLKQPTVQQVMKDAISKGPISVFLMGSHTNFALFLMSNPDLKKNIQHIFIMGGGVRSKNSTADIGNLFTTKTTNPYAEFNIFCDPFAAYQVFHSGIPITLVSLDATSDIPLTEEFFHEFEMWQDTYEAKYCFQLLKRTRDTWIGSFYTSFFMWDSFMSGISISIIENGFPTNGENEFAEMENLNLTVVTSNFPYGENDGSNPFFDTPKFNLKKNGVHSGHVQMGIDDSFCIVDNGKKKGICQDGYTKEVNGTEGVQITVAKNAKPNRSSSSLLTKQFYGNFLEALNHPQQSSRFNLTWQFSVDRQIQFKPDFSNSKLGKPVIFDMDMSTGDFLALIYLLKIPVHKLYLKAILISGNGWANAATIDIVYDILHMMGRDDIPVGLGAFSPMGFSSFSCKYIKEIPQGSGGFLDSDTLFGFAHHLPKSPRRYIVDLKLKQPLLATEIWEDILSEVLNGRSRKITILTSGPLTNLAKIVLKNKTSISSIQDVYIVGGHIADKNDSAKGNVFTVPSNQHSEFNFFLDPIAAKMVIESKLNVKLIPLNAQRKIASFSRIIEKLESSSHKNSTPEFILAHNLISQMYSLQKQNSARYQHVNMFLGEILGAVFLTNNIINNIDYLNATTRNMNINVLEGDVSISGQTILGGRNSVDVLLDFDGEAYFNHLVGLLSSANQQSSVIGSFHEQSFGNNGAFFNLYMCPYII